MFIFRKFLNKNKFEFEINCINKEINRYKRFGSNFCVLMLKISHAAPHGLSKLIPGKAVSYHITGKHLHLKKILRSYDALIKTTYRKYYVILPQTDEEGAKAVVERIHTLAQNHHWGEISISTALCPKDGENAHALLNKLNK